MARNRDLSKLLSTTNGKIGGSNLDVSFENISDTGTEGTKVASGTTAQRGSTAGQIRFNSTTGLAEYYTGTTFKSIDSPPTVSSLDVTEVDSQAGGNQTIVITGDNFQSGATVTFVGANGTDFNASTVTVDSVTQITAVAPKASFLNAQEPYGVKVQNTSGLSSTLASQINVDTAPSWSTASGQIGGSILEGVSTSTTVSATDADGDTVAYSVQSGSLPSGLSLNSSSGVISGTPSAVSSDTTSSFTLRATANTKTADRAFSMVVKQSNITNHARSNWSHPAVSGNRNAPSSRYFTSSSANSQTYQFSASSNDSGALASNYAWIQSSNGIASSYWRGQGTAPQQDTLELWFAGNEVTITQIKIHSYDSSSYEYNSVKLEYWNGSGWTKTVGIGSFSGNIGGWGWSKSGSNSRTNTITYTGSEPQVYKSTNWRFVYGTGGTDVHNGSDVVHQNGASELNFKILG